MVCLSCRDLGPAVCDRCRRTLVSTAPLHTPGGLVVHAWAAHEGAGRILVHRLKYESVVAVASVAAAGLVGRVPDDADSLVPVARTFVRRVRYGVDPASELAAALSRLCGLPVVHALVPPPWGPVNAGSRRADRVPPRFRRRLQVRSPVLVDDVVTTGATLDQARATLGAGRVALTVTGVP